MADFKVALAEFERQVSILEILLTTIEVSSGQDGITPVLVGDISLPLVPPGGKNTMAAAAIVLLASHFEEYVRQQVEQYAEGFIVEHAFLSDTVKEKLIDTYWRSGANKLARIRPNGFPAWASIAEPMLTGLIGYPVGGNIGSFQAKLVSEHDNNMRFDTVTDLCARVGVTKLSDLLHKWKPLRENVGDLARDKFSLSLRRKISDFYELRNGIVHSISQNAGVGATVVTQWLVFFRVFSAAFAMSMEDAFGKFENDIAKVKLAAAATAS